MTFTEAMDDVAKAFEVLGAAVLVLGLLLALAMSWRVWRRSRRGRVAYQIPRETFGGVLLLGLEIRRALVGGGRHVSEAVARAKSATDSAARK